MEQISREDFAEFVRNMRESLGMTRRNFAEALGLTYAKINNWERNASCPRNMSDIIAKIRSYVKEQHRKARIAK